MTNAARFSCDEISVQHISVMGEVRVKVKLTNVADQAAAVAGKISPDAVRTIEADAMVDTGAVRSCVPQPLLDRLGLQPADHSVVEYANGQKEAVGVAYGILFDIFNRRTSDDALVLGDEVLIGQTLLEKLDLLVDCTRQRLVPNPAHPDVAVNKLKLVRECR
jgi:hypothetical protein